MVVRTGSPFVSVGGGPTGNGLGALLCCLKPWDQQEREEGTLSVARFLASLQPST